MNYGTIIDNRLHPAPRAIRIGASVVCNPTPAQGKAALQTALGWTDEQVEAVLAAAEGGA